MIPTSQQQELLKDSHVGHLGEKTLLQIQECVQWPGITEDLRQYIRKYDVPINKNPPAEGAPHPT